MPEPIQHQRFSIPSRDGYPLRGDVRFTGTSTARPAIVVCHGFKGFKDWGFFPEIGAELARAGYLAVSFNFSGSGIGSDLENFTDTDRFEHATLSGDLDDLGRILDALSAAKLPGPRATTPFGLLGHSRGGGVGVLRAGTDERIGCLVTWSGVSRFDRWDRETLERWRRQGFVEVVNARTRQVFHLHTDILADFEAHADQLDVERSAGRLTIPYLVVHGTADDTVPVEEALALAKWGRGELHRVEAAGHTFGAVHPFAGRTPAFEDALGSTVAFFRRHLAPAT